MTPNASDQLPSVAEMSARVSYDPVTGVFVRLPLVGSDRHSKMHNTRFANRPTGSRSTSGYTDIIVVIDGVTFRIRAHRVAFALMTGNWPSEDVEIDHRNNDRSDNRWENFRLASHSQNGQSKGQNKRNTTGFKGVTFREGVPNPWKAQIGPGGKKIALGYFPTKEAAAAAYDRAAIHYFGEFAKTNASLGLL